MTTQPTPIEELPEPEYFPAHQHQDEERVSHLDDTQHPDHADAGGAPLSPLTSRSQMREMANRMDDDLALREVEREASHNASVKELARSSTNLSAKKSVDEFEAATNPLHNQVGGYNPPENPTTSVARIVVRLHNSSSLVRYLTYIVPVVLILLIPLLVGALAYPNADVGGVYLMWFCVWLEIFWLTLWAGRLVSRCLPHAFTLLSSLFTNNVKKYRDLGRQLEMPFAIFLWWLGVEISFLPTMNNHHVNGSKSSYHWEIVVNKIIVSFFVGVILNLVEKIIIQLIAISFHLRTYSDRIEINKFQIGSLTKLYMFSKEKIGQSDQEFDEQKTTNGFSARNPLQYADRATRMARGALTKVGNVAAGIAGDFTGRRIKTSEAHTVVLTLLNSVSGSQILARRLYRTFVREGFETVFPGDLKSAFDDGDEAEAAFAMFDRDMNGDISMEELETACVEVGRERKAITASLKDLDSVVSKLDNCFMFLVLVITVLVFISLISASTAGVLTSAGSTILALSWLFSASAQELLQSVIFVFVKHPFDVGDRITVYSTTSATGEDYFVKAISLLYTEFKKMEGHVVQAPNSYLNNLFILNQRRSGGLAEAVPIIIKFGTTLEQIEYLRLRLLEFVRSEKREYQSNILTEMRSVNENFSITLNVLFFYKSSWQNEALRLQRRNKFICHLMLALQNADIQGPKSNMPGDNPDSPYYITYQGHPPSYSAVANQDNESETRDVLGSLHGDSPRVAPVNSHHGTTGFSPHRQPSILRNRSVSSRRPRADSVGPSRHVDFSLGMSSLQQDDIVPDVLEDRGPGRLARIIRSVNNEESQREERDKQMERKMERSTSRAAKSGGRSSHDEPDLARVASRGSNTSASRPSIASSLRPRFLSRRLGHDSPHSGAFSAANGDEDLEQGRFDINEPKTTVSNSNLRRAATSYPHQSPPQHLPVPHIPPPSSNHHSSPLSRSVEPRPGSQGGQSDDGESVRSTNRPRSITVGAVEKRGDQAGSTGVPSPQMHSPSAGPSTLRQVQSLENLELKSLGR